MIEKKIKLGLITGLSKKPEEIFQKVLTLGFSICQLSAGIEEIRKFGPQNIQKCAQKLGVEIISCFLGFSGQVYNLKDGPKTMGFIPTHYRKERLKYAKKFSDLLRDMGIKYIFSHMGFIPDDENDPLYKSFLPVMREFVEYCGENGQVFCFETGQELPSTLKRTIMDLNVDNVGINFDPANLILYGMANPLDAIEIFGEYVKSMHAKDGLWPNRDEYLGKETPLGEGKVNFNLLIPRLKQKGFQGPIIIEREITGAQQRSDILKAKTMLETLL